MKNIKNFIPNAITLLNVLMGCFSILMAFQGNILWASYFIFAGGIFDFLDGMAARLLGAYSELGKQLDSLADMVTFGVAPSVIMFQLIKLAYYQANPIAMLQQNNIQIIIIPSIAFFIALFAAYRLAKFNIDTRQTESFIGVPTPATAFFVASLPFVINAFPEVVTGYIVDLYALYAVVAVLSFLMVSEIPMMSLKFKHFTIKGNVSRIVLVLISAVLLGFFQIAAYPIIFVVYLLLSIGENIMKKAKMNTEIAD